LTLTQAEDRLYRDYIHRLQSPEYPNYQYLCKLCSVHIENIQGAHKHIKEKRHKKNMMEKQEENELRALPPPSPAQLRAVDATVMETARHHGISEEDFEVRRSVVSRMEQIIQKHLTACSLRLYGSCLTRFAFKTSDINIDVTYPSPDVFLFCSFSAEFSEVESDFHAKVPAVFCRDVSSGLVCKVSAGNDVACLTTNHLAALAKLEPRLVPLVLAFRYWARLCHIDCQAEGGIPSYSFALMVIFFLQQRAEPILPVYLGQWIEGFDVKRVDEYHLTGIALDMFVRWEHRPQSSVDRGENRSDSRAENRTKTDQNKAEDAQYSEGLTRLTLDSGKEVSLGQLWLELLRFYTLEFALEEYIISIRLKEFLSREVKNWPRRRLAIEDPFALKRNVARSLNSQMVFEYIQERFRMAYKYFACPQRWGRRGRQRAKNAGKHRANLEGPEKKSETTDANDRKGRNMELESTESLDEEGPDPSMKNQQKTLESSLIELVLHDDCQPTKRSEVTALSPNGLLDSEEGEEEDEDEGEEEDKDERAPSEDLHYVFDKMIFTGGKPPTVVCSICKRDGHLKDECPEDFKKIELKPLPPMNERFRDILDGLCKLCFYELSPTLSEQQKREQILAGLERFIRKEYNDKAQLCLFGSSKNGFGFRDSDLDICMTLEGHDTAEKLNCKEIIEGLAKVLKKHTGLKNILPITTAKVPIVKFEHRQSGLEGDISLYNTLAQHNTRMLATYAALDPRVQYLGYTMKVFAKRCDIGDASRGSLSSYAYILMVLYFLQQRHPPVIPVLQEIFDGHSAPQRMVDGWNAFFFDDLEDLQQQLSELPPNTESVGELWLGLLRFYTEEFDFKEHVISIRQRKRLTTFEKQWTSKCIAIEDPFDLNHNLGAGVSRKMTNFIMKAFINGRKLFGTPFYPVPGAEVDYFFDSRVLTDGELAPNDRCCRICGKIGHYMKDCPKRRRIKKKDTDKDEDIKEDDRDMKERRCFQCGDMGHVRRDCPEYRHLKQRSGQTAPPHMVRSMVSSQSIPIPQSSTDGTSRTRQPSECVSNTTHFHRCSPPTFHCLCSTCSVRSIADAPHDLYVPLLMLNMFSTFHCLCSTRSVRSTAYASHVLYIPLLMLHMFFRAFHCLCYTCSVRSTAYASHVLYVPLLMLHTICMFHCLCSTCSVRSTAYAPHVLYIPLLMLHMFFRAFHCLCYTCSVCSTAYASHVLYVPLLVLHMFFCTLHCLCSTRTVCSPAYTPHILYVPLFIIYTFCTFRCLCSTCSVRSIAYNLHILYVPLLMLHMFCTFRCLCSTCSVGVYSSDPVFNSYVIFLLLLVPPPPPPPVRQPSHTPLLPPAPPPTSLLLLPVLWFSSAPSQ
uniref:RNA uridylyltransferase n=1 Tax=Sphaeramia orbicularis TaxID=375764 RepID=A0A673AZE0_9TELE